ncbi:hypothetical protein GCM10020001_046060 [Nonomuraea salmonea]
MSDLGHVLVLAGGLSYEREVSLRSGRRVSEVLRATGIDVEARDTDASLVPLDPGRPARRGLRHAPRWRGRGRRHPFRA